MSDLTTIEKLKLEKLLGMSSGYVLDFSNRTFAEFIGESVAIDIYDLKYNQSSGSKAHRLRAFWTIESNEIVSKLLRSLLDYYRHMNQSADHSLYDECMSIASRLGELEAQGAISGVATQPELTADDYRFIIENMYDSSRRTVIAGDIQEIIDRNEDEFMRGGHAQRTIERLRKKNIISVSPDGKKYKFTEPGLCAITEFGVRQQEWESSDVIVRGRVSARDQFLITPDKRFMANKFLREILGKARKEIGILDNYIGADIFDLVEEIDKTIAVKILTSDKIKKPVRMAYEAYRSQYGNADMRVVSSMDSNLHDRYIFIDGIEAWHLGHSIKDLGTKTCHINKVKIPADIYGIFVEFFVQK